MDNEHNNQGESGRATSLHERVRGRSLGDIRIHDSAQAGDLARRLGARAFTVGRDIYVQPELVNPATPQGEALLAHEATHAMEQSGYGSTASDMPLLRPHLNRWGSGGARGSSPVQRMASGASAPASLPASEVAAESAEASTLQSAQGSQSQGGAQSGQSQAQNQNTQAPEQPDPEELADLVYALMLHEVIIDVERNAHL